MKKIEQSKITIDDYKTIIQKNKFEEYPYVITGSELHLSSFINYSNADLKLKIYLCKLIICRCFSATDMPCLPHDLEWFISNFFATYEKDHLKPWLTDTIKEAVAMILSKEAFTKRIIGTTFMFGVIEFCVKYELGFRPDDYNFFDDEKKEYFQKRLGTKTFQLSIEKAFELLEKEPTELANSIKEIDKQNIDRLNEGGLKDEGKKGWISAKIRDRLSTARNAMLHGENHSFYTKGQYLILLYILFHLHRTMQEQ